MFISETALEWAIHELRRTTHPFLGITFAACKRLPLPVGTQLTVSLDGITRRHLDDHHKLDPSSDFYFQPFKSSQIWLNPKYPSAGLQAINTQTFATAFLHEKGTRRWGFTTNYLSEIANKLSSDINVEDQCPIEAFAIWLGKSQSWPESTSLDDIVSAFISDFSISAEERSALFSSDRNSIGRTDDVLLQEAPCDFKRVAAKFARPPDSAEQTHGTLKSLKLTGVGPSGEFEVSFGERLTVFVGDNGLGKSFLLDAAWRALTGSWAGQKPWVPSGSARPSARLQFTLSDQYDHFQEYQIQYSPSKDTWSSENGPGSLSTLCIYSKADGSFAISDQARASEDGVSHVDRLSVDEVWNGKLKRIEGLVRDWSNWKQKPETEDDEFQSLLHILRHLAPDDLGEIEPLGFTRFRDDIREIPTVGTAYGEVPITLLSAGVRRALQLAYIVIWTWYEHKRASHYYGTEEFKKLVLIVDEIEAHLHPKWQRVVLPSLLSLGKMLSEELEVQVITATHSPMVMASIETEFDEDADALYHLDLRDGAVRLAPLNFVKYGDMTAWLTSPVFGLGYARSKVAERAINVAKALQLEESPNSDEVLKAHEELKRVLGGDDTFWGRWMFFARQHGISE